MSDNGPQLFGDILASVAAEKPKSDLAKVHLLKRSPNQLTPVQARLLDAANPTHEHDKDGLCFQHTILCQTSLPYRDPGDHVRRWERRQSNASFTTVLEVDAGRIPDRKTKQYVDIGLPWGTKPRLILCHINAEALRQNSPVIEIPSSLSAFVMRIRGFTGGREIKLFKHQLACLSAARIRMASFGAKDTLNIETNIIGASRTPIAPEQPGIIEKFDLWLEKDENQRVLWPSTISLSRDYWESLKNHAVPIPENLLSALAHNAMALDGLCWATHRLPLINPRRPAFIAWSALKEQFGPDHKRMNDFRRELLHAFRQIFVVYPKAKITFDNGGMWAHCSPPPAMPRRRLSLLPKA